MKKIFFLSACLVALASQPVLAQTDTTDVIVVKVTENFGYLALDIARASAQPERREFNLKQLKEKGQGSYMGGQAAYTRSLLVELMQQGYALTTTYTANAGSGAGPTTLVFTKRQ